MLPHCTSSLCLGSQRWYVCAQTDQCLQTSPFSSLGKEVQTAQKSQREPS